MSPGLVLNPANKRIMESQATVTSSLSPQFRYVVLALWVLACTVLGWISLTDHRLFERVFFGVFSILGAGLLLVFIEEESALVSNHMLAHGEVVSYRPRRGRWLGGPEYEYRFTALDGRLCEGSSSGRARPGERIALLYNPLLPKKNKPLAAFVFYRFEFPEAS